MNIALLLADFPSQDFKQLSSEFPKLLFLPYPRHPLQPVTPEAWKRTEVIYGERLTADELESAPELRWIHSPTPNLNKLCLKEIEAKGNILISFTKDEHAFEIAEFVFAGFLAFAKNLFQFKEVNRFPHLVWDCKWRNTIETLKKKTLLQIGLGKVGLEIARRAALSDMSVIGMSDKRSYHPHCEESLDYSELKKALPKADFISIALPRDQGLPIKLGKEELALIKNNAILSMIGFANLVDEEALAEAAPRFRGIILDSYYQFPIPPKSKLWSIPNLIITPEVSPRPKTQGREAFRTFRYNLRQYLHDNFADMKNVVDPRVAYTPELEWLET